MRCVFCLAVVSISLLGCGDDGDGNGGGNGGGSGSEPTCSIGVHLTGDADAQYNVDEDVGCSYGDSVGSGLSASLMPDDGGVQTFFLDVGSVTEGQTGPTFPFGMTVILDSGDSYSTSASGCSVAVTEHRHTDTETSSSGELREYQVAGNGTCTEVAASDDGGSGQIAIGAVSFRFLAMWAD